MTTHATHQGPSRHGGLGNASPGVELGTIVAVDAENYAYTVRSPQGTHTGTPRARHSNSDLTLLSVGDTVILRYDVGFPYIDGVLDIQAARPEDSGVPTTGVAPTSLDAMVPTSPVGAFRAPGEPSDHISGDTVFGNAAGARIGVLEGGVALLMGSPLSAIRAHLLNNLVEIISRNYRHVTDMGEFTIRNRDGRVNMSFRGASDQVSEAAGTEQKWTVYLDIGAVGDLFDFRLTTPSGQTLFRMHVDSDGRCEIFGLDGVIIQSGARSGEAAVTESGGDAQHTVRGSSAQNVTGDRVCTVGGNDTCTVAGTATTSVGHDCALSAAHDYAVTAGNAMGFTANEHTTTVLDGDYLVNVGQQTKPNGRVKIETLRGGIALKSKQGGNLELETSTGTAKIKARKVTLDTNASDSVILGGDTLAAHIVRFEQFETFVRAQLQAHDTHQHPIPTGGLSGVPVVPLSATLGRLIAACKSLRVGVGG